MRVAILGDIHQNVRYLDWALAHAADAGAELVIQVGDFGFNFNEGFLGALEQTTNKYGIPLWAVRGNHDDPGWFKGYRRMGYVDLIPDGYVTDIGAKRVAFLGGAVSIDRNGRSEYIDWWSDERVDPNIVNVWSMADERADVLICHDSPVLPENLPDFTFPPDIFNDCEEDRRMVRHAVDILEPETVYHGHYHIRHSKEYFGIDGKKTLVEGLNCDGNPINQSMIIRDW